MEDPANDTKMTRSEMMSGIGSKNTKPELLVRKSLHARGYRYRLHRKDLPGKPDLVLPRHRVAIFINGCFWHGHNCRLFKWPKTRPEFWKEKICKNQERDKRQIEDLMSFGWRVFIVWECAIKTRRIEALPAVTSQIHNWIAEGQQYGQASSVQPQNDFPSGYLLKD